MKNVKEASELNKLIPPEGDSMTGEVIACKLKRVAKLGRDRFEFSEKYEEDEYNYIKNHRKDFECLGYSYYRSIMFREYITIGWSEKARADKTTSQLITSLLLLSGLVLAVFMIVFLCKV